MSKSCAKCTKTVYPLEELKCLDKIWHKGCFRCTECGMILNMKTYKGFDKLPYCEAHIPKAKATTVADTPEMKRIQENTKIQSNAAYHAEFEKTKGKFTAVTDDPEMQRLKGNTKIISNVTYHGDLEKKAVMEGQRTLGRDEKGSNGVPPPSMSPSYMDELASVPTNTQRYGPPPTTNYNQPPPPPPQQYRSAPPPNSYHHSSGDERAQHQSYSSPAPPQYTAPPQQQQQYVHHQPSVNTSSPYSARGAPNVVYSSDVGAVNASPSRKVGSIADFDPVNNYFGSLDQQQAQRAQQAGRVGKGGILPQQQQQQAQQNHHRAQVPPPIDNGYGICYRALYDYEAQDRDEVSFMDGDLITNCTAVDEGWMTGTVQRNGHRGMLPANYVTPTSTN